MSANHTELIAEHLEQLGEGAVFSLVEMLTGLGLDPTNDARRLRDLRDFGWELATYKDDRALEPGKQRIDRIGTMPGRDGAPRSATKRVATLNLDDFTPEELQRLRTYLREGLQPDRAADAYRTYQRMTDHNQQRLKADLLDRLT